MTPHPLTLSSQLTSSNSDSSSQLISNSDSSSQDYTVPHLTHTVTPVRKRLILSSILYQSNPRTCLTSLLRTQSLSQHLHSPLPAAVLTSISSPSSSSHKFCTSSHLLLILTDFTRTFRTSGLTPRVSTSL